MFPIRIPLLNTVDIIIYRLDIQATWAVDPPGPATEGYDYVYREPVVERNAGVRTVNREEMAPVTVEVQVETQTFEQLQAAFGGDNAATDQAFVAHREQLADLGLLDAGNKCVLKPGDRIDHVEKDGVVVLSYEKPLYIYEVRPRSWGCGPTGYDLEIIYTTHRSADPRNP